MYLLVLLLELCYLGLFFSQLSLDLGRSLLDIVDLLQLSIHPLILFLYSLLLNLIELDFYLVASYLSYIRVVSSLCLILFSLCLVCGHYNLLLILALG